jgi:hypothetical protein
MKIKLYYPFLEINQAREIGEADVSARVIEQVANGMRDISFFLLPSMTLQKIPETVPAAEKLHRIYAKVVRVHGSDLGSPLHSGAYSREFHSTPLGWIAVLNEYPDRQRVRALKGEWVAI